MCVAAMMSSELPRSTRIRRREKERPRSDYSPRRSDVPFLFLAGSICRQLRRPLPKGFSLEFSNSILCNFSGHLSGLDSTSLLSASAVDKFFWSLVVVTVHDFAIRKRLEWSGHRIGLPGFKNSVFRKNSRSSICAIMYYTITVFRSVENGRASNRLRSELKLQALTTSWRRTPADRFLSNFRRRTDVTAFPVCSGLGARDRKQRTRWGARSLRTENPPRISMCSRLNEEEVGSLEDSTVALRNENERNSEKRPCDVLYSPSNSFRPKPKGTSPDARKGFVVNPISAIFPARNVNFLEKNIHLVCDLFRKDNR